MNIYTYIIASVGLLALGALLTLSGVLCDLLF
jgi:hypothetical protein